MKKKDEFTADVLFKDVVGYLKEDGLFPDSIDCCISNKDCRAIQSTNCEIWGRLYYGGIEGIYLDIRMVERYSDGCGRNPVDRVYNLGFFKTLDRNPEAMRIMGTLMADFTTYAYAHIADKLDSYGCMSRRGRMKL